MTRSPSGDGPCSGCGSRRLLPIRGFRAASKRPRLAEKRRRRLEAFAGGWRSRSRSRRAAGARRRLSSGGERSSGICTGGAERAVA